MNKHGPIGIIEELVRETRFVGRGIQYLKYLAFNYPTFEPDRRRFMDSAAKAAGALVLRSTMLGGAAGALASCEAVNYPSNKHSFWEAYLLSQDLIRGPSLLIDLETGLQSDFAINKTKLINQGWGAVDYDVPRLRTH